jgi:hypothetical protein
LLVSFLLPCFQGLDLVSFWLLQIHAFEVLLKEAELEFDALRLFSCDEVRRGD